MDATEKGIKKKAPYLRRSSQKKGSGKEKSRKLKRFVELASAVGKVYLVGRGPKARGGEKTHEGGGRVFDVAQGGLDGDRCPPARKLKNAGEKK